MEKVITELNINDNGIMADVLGMIEKLENGEEPIMFKICMGTATPEEISEWASNNNIPSEDIETVINSMKSSFMQGNEIAENIETSPSDTETSNDQLLSRLDLVLSQLDNIYQEVMTISDIVRNRK